MWAYVITFTYACVCIGTWYPKVGSWLMMINIYPVAGPGTVIILISKSSNQQLLALSRPVLPRITHHLIILLLGYYWGLLLASISIAGTGGWLSSWSRRSRTRTRRTRTRRDMQWVGWRGKLYSSPSSSSLQLLFDFDWRTQVLWLPWIGLDSMCTYSQSRSWAVKVLLNN